MGPIPYESIRDSIQSGDAFEFTSNGLLGRLIRFFDKEPVNHTALCLNISEYSNFCGNRKFFLEANAPGIELSPISRVIHKYSGRLYYRKLKATDEQRAIISDWALQQAGCRYDYGSLFKNILGHVSADAGKYFCSEFRFIALVVGGVIPGMTYNKDTGAIRDRAGSPVKAPRPGEFDQYGIDEPAIEIQPPG